ncbi:MAG: Na-translocating system protein MpsC family protein [Nitrospira sp.]
MARVLANKAEIEYAVVLAVLNFQTDFMKSLYSHVQAHVYDELIYVTSVRSSTVPAEKALARSPEGRELLCRFHRAMFDSCEHVLREQIEQAIGVKVHNIVPDLDPEAGRSILVIKLLEPITQSATH